jgi:hypothetical protein
LDTVFNDEWMNARDLVDAAIVKEVEEVLVTNN